MCKNRKPKSVRRLNKAIAAYTRAVQRGDNKVARRENARLENLEYISSVSEEK